MYSVEVINEKIKIGISDIVGLKIDSVNVEWCNHGFIEFRLSDGDLIVFDHEKECCEDVWLEDVCGDIKDLKGEVIIEAFEVSDSYPPENPDYEITDWTFYSIRTMKGDVTLRFCAHNYGQYSTSVDIFRCSTKRVQYKRT